MVAYFGTCTPVIDRSREKIVKFVKVFGNAIKQLKLIDTYGTLPNN